MNGREYLAYLADNGFDILLTDEQIEGGVDGLTLYQWNGNKEEKGLLQNPQVEIRRGVYKNHFANS